MAESGFPGFDMMAWFGLLAPAHTPPWIVSRLSDVLLKGLQAGEARQRIGSIGGEPGRLTPAEFGQYIRAENAHWSKIFADGVVRLEQ
jgi:tripartite-type tricarboxylate transporter receptor subunit TctC